MEVSKRFPLTQLSPIQGIHSNLPLLDSPQFPGILATLMATPNLKWVGTLPLVLVDSPLKRLPQVTLPPLDIPHSPLAPDTLPNLPKRTPGKPPKATQGKHPRGTQGKHPKDIPVKHRKDIPVKSPRGIPVKCPRGIQDKCPRVTPHNRQEQGTPLSPPVPGTLRPRPRLTTLLGIPRSPQQLDTDSTPQLLKGSLEPAPMAPRHTELPLHLQAPPLVGQLFPFIRSTPKPTHRC